MATVLNEDGTNQLEEEGGEFDGFSRKTENGN